MDGPEDLKGLTRTIVAQKALWVHTDWDGADAEVEPAPSLLPMRRTDRVRTWLTSKHRASRAPSGSAVAGI